ncbi:hypothetical protein HDU96_005491 [Phlyctochytrium bullatum]|nr:hypothetical protein HDU96_005491 [Phlyctochytrium bullatum]
MNDKERLLEKGKKRLRKFQTAREQVGRERSETGSPSNGEELPISSGQVNKPSRDVPFVERGNQADELPHPGPEILEREYISFLLEEKNELAAKNTLLEEQVGFLEEENRILKSSKTHSNHGMQHPNASTAADDEVQKLEASLRALRMKNAEQERTIHQLEQDLIALRTERRLSFDRSSLTEGMAAITSKDDTLENKMAQIEVLMSEKNTLIGENQTYLSYIGELATCMNEVIKALKTVELEIEEKRDETSRAVNGKDSTIVTLTNQVNDLKNEISTVQETERAASTKYAKVIDRVSALQSENAELITQLEELRSRNVHLSNQLAETADALFEERRVSEVKHTGVADYLAALEVLRNYTGPLPHANFKDVGLTTTLGDLLKMLEKFSEQNNALSKALEDEQRLTTLLQAEVQCLPEYINLYHNARQKLRYH